MTYYEHVIHTNIYILYIWYHFRMYTTLCMKLLFTFYIYIQVQTYTYSIFQLHFNFNRFVSFLLQKLNPNGVYTISLEALDTGHSIVT